MENGNYVYTNGFMDEILAAMRDVAENRTSPLANIEFCCTQGLYEQNKDL